MAFMRPPASYVVLLCHVPAAVIHGLQLIRILDAGKTVEKEGAMGSAQARGRDRRGRSRGRVFRLTTRRLGFVAVAQVRSTLELDRSGDRTFDPSADVRRAIEGDQVRGCAHGKRIATRTSRACDDPRKSWGYLAGTH